MNKLIINYIIVIFSEILNSGTATPQSLPPPAKVAAAAAKRDGG